VIKRSIVISAALTLVIVGVGVGVSLNQTETTAAAIKIKSSVPAAEGVVAWASSDPLYPLRKEYASDLTAVVQGKVIDAEYGIQKTAEGKTKHFTLEFPYSVLTIAIDKSTTGLSGDIKVWATGALIPSADGAPNSYDEYLSTGQGHALQTGENVILFLQKALGQVKKRADYTILGAAYGTFIQDASTGEFVRTIELEGNQALSATDLSTIFSS